MSKSKNKNNKKKTMDIGNGISMLKGGWTFGEEIRDKCDEHIASYIR